MGMTLPPKTHPVEFDENGWAILIDRNADQKRINGLIWEDRVRTTLLFPPYAMPLHPQSPVDMPPEMDLIQGIATQVKSFKAKRGSRDKQRRLIGTIAMACSYNLLKLIGHIRLIIGIYDVENRMVDGKMTEVMVFHTVVEMILSPATLNAFHIKPGTDGVGVAEMKDLRDEMADFEICEETKQDAKEKFGPTIEDMRKRMGIANVHAKIDAEQCRPQTTVGLSALAQRLALEGDYHGHQIQANYREYHEGEIFYGLPLPWRTVAKERVFIKPRDPDQKKQRRRRKTVATTETSGNQALEGRKHDLEDADMLPTPFGEVSIVTHDDGLRTLRAESDDREDRRRVSIACHAACGGDRTKWITGQRAWLLNGMQTPKVVADLRHLPDDDGPSVMATIKADGSLRKLPTADGPVTVLRLERDNYALRHDNVMAVDERIHATCRAHAVGTYHMSRHGGNWLIPQKPPELIERVARAIRDRRRGDHGVRNPEIK